jgi:LysR family transcriptional activator of nhaA
MTASAWLNYHHLHYFWTVVREGSIAAASRKLRLAQPTVSTQIKTLEQQLGVPLFDRSGRRLELTDAGRETYRYADEIFSIGQELLENLQGGKRVRTRLHIGITHVLPKLVAYRLIEPALAIEGMIVHCQQDRFERLLTRLAAHELDLVVSDVPLGPEVSVKAFNHVLGQSEVSFFAAPALAVKLRRGFPGSLDGARVLLPMPGSTLRRELDRWFEAEQLRPQLVGEFDDSALLKVFGQSGAGVFAGPSVIENEIKQQYDVQLVGRTDAIHERFYAITVERRLRHPGVVAISAAAKSTLFTG